MQTQITADKPEELTVDQKLDRIMEALVLQQRMLFGAMKAMEEILSKTNSKIIKL